MQKKKEKKGKVRISLKASAVNLATPTLLPGFNVKHDNTVIRCRKSQMMFKTYISIYNFALFSLHQWFSYCKNDEKLLEKLTSVKEKSQFVWPRGKLIKQLPPQHCWHTAGTDITIFKYILTEQTIRATSKSLFCNHFNPLKPQLWNYWHFCALSDSIHQLSHGKIDK